MALHPALSPEQASAELARLGIAVSPDEVRAVERDGRWVVMLPGERMAWFAATEDGRGCMSKERRVLRLLADRCGLVVPRVLLESPGGDVDVRAMVPGTHDLEAVLRRLVADHLAGIAVGAALGASLAELHGCVAGDEVAGWLPRAPIWPRPRAWVSERLPEVTEDVRLRDAAYEVMDRFEAVHDQVTEADRALIHADLGLHNLAIDPISLHVAGIFDWESACWADRHLDFRYLEYQTGRRELLDSAVDAYELATGYRISRNRISLYNAASAITYLAYRAGVPADESWCGRTLREDLSWTRAAIARLRSVEEDQ